MLLSQTCTQGQLESDRFRHWARQMKQPTDRLHRKIWEWSYIAEALSERGMLAPGKRGLGFAVGKEPLTALFAREGCEIVATDLEQDRAQRRGLWVESGQNAQQLGDLNIAGICPDAEFARLVRFRNVDMNHIPSDLGGFDFCWSSCSIEHLGSIGAARRFLIAMTRCLKPGGVAVHTTEYNVHSNYETIKRGYSAIFRRRDLLGIQRMMEALGCEMAPWDFSPGHTMADGYVDTSPYRSLPHLKLLWKGHVATSIGLIITMGPEPVPARRRWERLRSYLGNGDLPTIPTWPRVQAYLEHRR